MLKGILDIEIYDTTDPKELWAQAKFLVHGVDDVLWTDDIVDAIRFFTESVARLSETKLKQGFSYLVWRDM